MWSHMNFTCDVCDSTKMRYSAWNSRFLRLTILYCTIVCISIHVFDSPTLMRKVSIYILMFIAVASKGHFAYNIAMEYCDELGIRFFKVKSKQI